jgi:quercetin dioxygenase-like cupin family protein
MAFHRWADIPLEQMNPSFSRQVIHTDRMTIARVTLSQGSIVPRHQHENEQVTVLESGRLRFQFDDHTAILHGGEVLQIASNVPHLVEALEDSVAYDLFAPPRADWIRGDDAYLRR